MTPWDSSKHEQSLLVYCEPCLNDAIQRGSSEEHVVSNER
jgi:hypothetical protein